MISIKDINIILFLDLFNERMQEGEDSISYILNNIDAMLAFLEYRRENCERIIRDSSDLEIDKIILNLEKLYDHIALEEERLKNNAVKYAS